MSSVFSVMSQEIIDLFFYEKGVGNHWHGYK